MNQKKKIFLMILATIVTFVVGISFLHLLTSINFIIYIVFVGIALFFFMYSLLFGRGVIKKQDLRGLKSYFLFVPLFVGTDMGSTFYFVSKYGITPELNKLLPFLYYKMGSYSFFIMYLFSVIFIFTILLFFLKRYGIQPAKNLTKMLGGAYILIFLWNIINTAPI